MFRRHSVVLFVPLILALVALSIVRIDAPAQAAIDWPQPVFTRVVSGLSQPTAVTHAGDGSGRIFVVERLGKIRIVRNGVLSATPFLDVGGKIVSSGQEQGLLGLAFPPGYAQKGYFYVSYTRRSDNADVVARYRISSADVADPNSEQIIIAIPDPYANHNGGQLAFGPDDGFLYYGTGDGGSAGDPQNRAQNLNEQLGKMLRLDVESGASPYAIPGSNPTLGGRRSELWAYGLRNPWRFSFDRQTHDLYIADVGQGTWEEVDFQPAGDAGGENYGWRLTEGTHCFNPATGCPTAGITMPVTEYDHSSGGCSVTGGYVYRGPGSPRLQGVYVYGDYCSGKVWGLKRDGSAWQSQQIATTTYAISTFGEDEAGNLYLADFGGTLYQVTDPAADPCNGSSAGAPSFSGRFKIYLPLVPRGGCGV